MHARIRDLAIASATPLVSYPNALQVEVAVGLQTVRVDICGHRADTGSLLGADCRHVNAITRLLSFVARDRQVKVSIGEGHIGTKDARQSIPFKRDWSKEENDQLVAIVSDLVDGAGVLGFTIRTESAGYSSTVCVLTPVPVPEGLQEAVNDIARAWGRRRGRKVSVEIGHERPTV